MYGSSLSLGKENRDIFLIFFRRETMRRLLLFLMGGLLCVAPNEALQAVPRSKVSLSSKPPEDPEKGLRLAVLATVPLCWGTFSPSVRYIYETETAHFFDAIPNGFSLAFSAAYYVVALCTLSLASTFQKTSSGGGPSPKGVSRAGLELGSYLFLGNCAQVVGLQSTTADAAAFLVQLTTIIVPTLEARLNGGYVSERTRRACLLAFCGVAVICGGDVLRHPGAFAGDSLIVLAAIFYSLHVVRLSAFAPHFEPLDLALAKAKTETFLAVLSVTLLFLYYTNDFDAFFSSTTANNDAPPLIAAVLWCGAVTTAYTIWAQSFGQRSVSPASANLIYTSQPIFSALFAYLLVGEQPTVSIAIGGTIILLAVLSDLLAEDLKGKHHLIGGAGERGGGNNRR